MSYRVFFTAQQGRDARAPALPPDDAPWGTTSSSVMRAYEPAEMRSVRSLPSNVRVAMQPSSLAASCKVTPESSKFKRSQAEFLDPRAGGSMVASAVTMDSRSASSREPEPSYLVGRGGGKLPEYEKNSRRPPPERAYLGLQTLKQDLEATAATERQRHFPYRDEHHPRSKRLMYELALQNLCQDDAKSCSTDAESQISRSCFTMASSKASRSTASRSQSESVISRLMTADSKRVTAPGGIAKRRMQAQQKAPMQWPADEKWLRETVSKDGPAGLQCANLVSGQLEGTCSKHAERIAIAKELFGGRQDNFGRHNPDKPAA